jgi:hypothetical protein
MAPPPISREDAQAHLGPINDEAWLRMVEAFDWHRGIEHLYAASPVAANLLKRHAKAARELEKAQAVAMGILRDLDLTRSIIAEASRHPDKDFELDLRAHLGTAAVELSRARMVLKIGQPSVSKGASDAERKRRLVRRLHRICGELGLPVKLTTGFENDRPDGGISEANLSPFERFISAAGVHIGDTPHATAKWIRDACQPENKPRADAG